MKNERLRDGEATDPTWSAIERLCRSQPPSRPDLAMQARVLERLERPRLRRALRLRPAFVAVCLLLFAATASALWGTARRWLAPTRPAATAPLASPERSAPTHAEITPPTSVPPPPLAVRADSPLSRAPRHKQVLAPERISHSPEAQPVEATTPTPSSGAPLLDPQESLLVHSAVRALRVERRTSRARALLSEYLIRFPHGALAEDALALEIEAAMAERDRGAARRWATRYLGDFPSGRFRTVADSVLHEDSSKGNDDSRP
jgi:hypothetical protein